VGIGFLVHEVVIPCMHGLYSQCGRKIEKSETTATSYFWRLNGWTVRFLLVSMTLSALTAFVLFSGATNPAKQDGKKKVKSSRLSRIPIIFSLGAALSSFLCLAHAKLLFRPHQYDEWAVSYWLNLASGTTALVLALPLTFRRWLRRGIGKRGETATVLKSQMPRIKYEPEDIDDDADEDAMRRKKSSTAAMMRWTVSLKSKMQNLSSTF